MIYGIQTYDSNMRVTKMWRRANKVSVIEIIQQQRLNKIKLKHEIYVIKQDIIYKVSIYDFKHTCNWVNKSYGRKFIIQSVLLNHSEKAILYKK